MYLALHVKYPLLLSYFKENLIFSRDFRNIIEYQISWKSAQLQPRCSMRTDGYTNMMKLILREHLKSAFKIWVNDSALIGKQILVDLWRGIQWQICFAMRSSNSNVSGLYLGEGGGVLFRLTDGAWGGGLWVLFVNFPLSYRQILDYFYFFLPHT
jgi:hypothetical protein